MDECTVSVKQAEGAADTLTVRVSGSMTIGSIREVHARLLDAFSRGSGVCLDLRGVEEIDLSGLQIVCAAHRSAIRNCGEFTVEGNQREVIVAAARAAGFIRNSGCDKECDYCYWAGGDD